MFCQTKKYHTFSFSLITLPPLIRQNPEFQQS